MKNLHAAIAAFAFVSLLGSFPSEINAQDNTGVTGNWMACLNYWAVKLDGPTESAQTVADAAFGKCLEQQRIVREDNQDKAQKYGLNRYDPDVEKIFLEHRQNVRLKLISFILENRSENNSR